MARLGTPPPWVKVRGVEVLPFDTGLFAFRPKILNGISSASATSAEIYIIHPPLEAFGDIVVVSP